MLNRLEKLIEAIEHDDYFGVTELLEEDNLSPHKIPLKYIAGALVIAAEKNSINSFNVIIEYNSKLPKSIPKSYIKAAYTMFKHHAAEQTNMHLATDTATVH